MPSHNVSVYLEDIETWQKFKQACAKVNKRPNSVLRAFIEKYCDEILEREIPIEQQIAHAMLETKAILQGKAQGKDARNILDEI